MQVNELKAEAVRNGMTMEALASKSHMTRTTLWRRLSNPDEFTRMEIRAIAQALNLSSERVMDIFFADKVS